jgi:hypothetical protein
MINLCFPDNGNQGYLRSVTGTLHFGVALVAVADYGQPMVVSFPWPRKVPPVGSGRKAVSRDGCFEVPPSWILSLVQGNYKAGAFVSKFDEYLPGRRDD